MGKADDKLNAYILAGGQSSRMEGYPKGLLQWDNRSLVLHIAKEIEPLTGNIFLNTNHPGYQELNIPLVPDQNPVGNGPLEGIITSLQHSDKPFNLIVACDMPNLNTSFFQWFYRQLNLGMEVLVPFWKGGIQPLCGFYQKKFLPLLQNYEAEEILKLKHILCDTHASTVTIHNKIPGFHKNLFSNINTLTDYYHFFIKSEDHEDQYPTIR